jgi:hypothetical protein
MNTSNNSKSLLSEIFAKSSMGTLSLIQNTKAIPGLLNHLLMADETEKVCLT